MAATSAALAGLRARVLDWYAAERRDLPWRGTRDPYAVLVSEVMLQQTQASRVAVRYQRFIRRFPTAGALAASPVASVLVEWSGLGYNRRAIQLHRAATVVVREGWPQTVGGLERLPGVGPYTARALASLAFGQPVAGVDTNVRRWLVRRLRIANRARELQACADALAAEARTDVEAADWMHASMELGAQICTARRPRCAACPVRQGCPSRHGPARVAVVRQAAFIGSDRSRRGALIRALSAATDHRLGMRAARAAVGRDLDAGAFERLLNRLEKDGLLHRRRNGVRLGMATIEP